MRVLHRPPGSADGEGDDTNSVGARTRPAWGSRQSLSIVYRVISDALTFEKTTANRH